MATVTISLPEPMKDWIEGQASNGQFSGGSDYIRGLGRRNLDPSLDRGRGERSGKHLDPR
mgnify:CR=1 FL=1